MSLEFFANISVYPSSSLVGYRAWLRNPPTWQALFNFSFVSFVHYLFDCGLPFYKKHPFWVQLWYIFLRKMPPDFHQSKSQKSPCILCELGTSEVLIYLLPLKDATNFFGVLYRIVIPHCFMFSLFFVVWKGWCFYFSLSETQLVWVALEISHHHVVFHFNLYMQPNWCVCFKNLPLWCSFHIHVYGTKLFVLLWRASIMLLLLALAIN